MREKNPKNETSSAGHRGRLREKFISAGLTGFHDYEAVELLLSYAIPRRDVKPLAKKLVAKFGGIRGIIDAGADELLATQGVGPHSAVLIGLVKELATAYLKEGVTRGKAVSSPADVVDFLALSLSGERIEKFMALFLNSKNEVIAIETLHEGTLDQTSVYPRKVLEEAFKHNARSVIFVHNHPSGDATPSSSDLKLTTQLENAAKTVDLLVHDHIVIGKEKHYSIKEKCWVREKKGAL